MQIPFGYKLGMATAAFFLTFFGVVAPAANYLENMPKEYHAKGVAGVPVDVHSRPSGDSAVIGRLEPLAAVDVVAEKEHDDKGVSQMWFRIKYNEGYGWVRQDGYPRFETNVRLGTYVRMARESRKGTEEFYLHVLQKYNKNPDVGTEAAVIAAKELHKIGSEAGMLLLREYARTDPALRDTLIELLEKR